MDNGELFGSHFLSCLAQGLYDQNPSSGAKPIAQ